MFRIYKAKVRFLSGRYSFLRHDIESLVNIGTAPIHCLLAKKLKMMYLSLLCPKPWQDHQENLFRWDFLAFQMGHRYDTSSYVNYWVITWGLNYTFFFSEDGDLAWRLFFKVKWRNTTRIFGVFETRENLYLDYDPMHGKWASYILSSIVCNLWPPLM